jgi:hypothetical protein
MTLGRFELTNDERDKVKKAMIDFCIRCMGPKTINITTGQQKDETEGEVAILPRILEILFNSTGEQGIEVSIPPVFSENEKTRIAQ